MEEIEKIIDYFLEDNFQSILQTALRTIEKKLNNFIVNYNQSYSKHSGIKISQKVQSRIKSKDSLKEKLSRKNYLDEWKIYFFDEANVQKAICENLPDLIGFRINCYFKEDERAIFEELIKYLSKEECIEIEKNPQTVQKNGHTIYKIACKYKELFNIFCFEVQVKSLLHDAWGEVEHSIVYKSKAFDSRENLKKEIVEGIYTILDGTDKQLSKLFLFKTSIKEIKHELFYEYSKIDLRQKCLILGEHYKNFFELISYIDNSEDHIDEYLGKKLLNQEYCRKKLSDFQIEVEITKFKDEFDQFKFDMFCSIAFVLYDFESNEILLKHLIKGIYDIGVLSIDDEFDDLDHTIISEEINETIKKVLSCIEKNDGK